MKNQQNYLLVDGSYIFRLIVSIIFHAIGLLAFVLAISQRANGHFNFIIIIQFISGLLCLITDVAIYKDKWIENFSTVYVIFVIGLSMGYYTFFLFIWSILLGYGTLLISGSIIIIIISTFFRQVINSITIIKMSKIVNKADTADTYDLYNGDSDDIQNIND